MRKVKQTVKGASNKYVCLQQCASYSYILLYWIWCVAPQEQLRTIGIWLLTLVEQGRDKIDCGY